MIMQPPAPQCAGIARFGRGLGPSVDLRRTHGDRRLPDGLGPPAGPSSTREDSLPALPRLENQGGAGKSGQDHEDPEGLSLQHASHLIKTSAGQRRG